MGKGRRYESNEKKLNIKKVIAVLLAILVVIIGIYAIKSIIDKDADLGKKITTNYFAVYTKSTWGVVDSTGDIVIDPIYEEMIIVPNNKKDVFICTYDVDYTNNTYKTKAINKKNKTILTGFDQIEALENYDENNNVYYEQNVLRVKKDNKYGLIDFEGKVILDCVYDEITALKGVENSILIKQDSKLGVVDNLGTVIAQPKYTTILPMGKDYKMGYITTNAENKHGLINFDGTTILEEKYEDIKNITGNSLYYVQEQGVWKLIDETNTVVLESNFDDIIEINGDNIVIKKQDKFGIIDTEGKEVLPLEYESLHFAYSDYYIAKQNEKYGLIGTDKVTALDFKYEKIEYRKGANFIGATNENIETEIYDSELNLKLIGIVSKVDLEKGYMKIRIGNEYKYYNFKFEEKKSSEVLTASNLFLSKKNGKYGYTDKNGNLVVEYAYDDAQEQNSFGYVAVKKDGKWGSLDRNGKVAIEPTYELKDNLIIDFIGKWHLGLDLNMNYYTDMK